MQRSTINASKGRGDGVVGRKEGSSYNCVSVGISLFPIELKCKTENRKGKTRSESEEEE